MDEITEVFHELQKVKDARITNLLETIEIMKKTIKSQEEIIKLLKQK